MMVWSLKKSPPLIGEVSISSSKNAALPILAATLMIDGETELLDLPHLSDINVMLDIIRELGGRVKQKGYQTQIVTQIIQQTEPNHALVRGMRASFLCMGALLARHGEATMALPGGCKIGTRPVDMHLHGLQQLGAEIKLEGGLAIGKGKLVGDHIALQFPSVGATENIIMAATLAEGESVISNAAQEPEIVDLCNFLNVAGAHIQGAGSNRVIVNGVKKLNGITYRPIPDRIEGGTFMYAAAVTGGDILIKNFESDHVGAVIDKLREGGILVDIDDRGVRIKAQGTPKGLHVRTMPFPGFPTDLQAPAMVLGTVSNDLTFIQENIFENRFSHAQELNRMGAHIDIQGRTAIVQGNSILRGARVRASDLRAGAALILAGLCAEGETQVVDTGHVKRGYESFAVKLNGLGADMRLLLIAN